MRVFLLGAPCAGKTTLVEPLRSVGITVIDTDDEIVRLNGGTWPDIETKNARFLPQVLDAAAALDEVVLLNSYLPLERTRQLRGSGFVVALLDVDPDELRRRDAVRQAEEGWTNIEWLDWHQSVIQDHRHADLIDQVIDGHQDPEQVARDVAAVLRG